MYALYSKAFSKKAVDLNKKDFLGKYGTKVTMKGGADGTNFEVNASDEGGSAYDVKIETKVDDAFNVSLKVDNNSAAEVEAAAKVSDALKVVVKAVNPEPAMTSTTVNGEFEYLDSQFSAEGKFSLLAAGRKPNLGVSCGLACGLPGFDGVSVGANPGFSSASGFDMPISVGYGSKAFQLSLDSGYHAGGITGGSLKGWYQTNDKLAVAFDVTQSTYDFGKDGSHTAGKANSDGMVVKVGAEYKLSAGCTGKAKWTMKGGKKTLDLALKQALDGKSSVSTGIQCNDGKPAVCFTYNLE